MKTRSGKDELEQRPPTEKKAQGKKVVRSARSDEKFLVGKSIETIPKNRLPLRIQLIQKYWNLREKNPFKPLAELVCCPMDNNFRLSCLEDGLGCKAGCLVSSVVDTWTRAGFKIIAIHHVRTHIINYINKYMAVRKSRYKMGLVLSDPETHSLRR